MGNTGIRIRISDVLFAIQKRWMIILGLTFAGTLFGLMLSVMTMLESSVQNYAVTGSFAVSTKFGGIFLNGSTDPSNMDFNVSEEMVDAVLYIVKSDKVIDGTINESGILNVTISKVKNNITVVRYSDTQVVEMTLLWPNADEGLILWKALVEKTNELLPSTLMMGSINVIDEPKATLMGAGNTSKLIAVFMALLGMAGGFAYAIMEMLMHPTLTNTRDSDEYFGIETIGTVPLDPAYFRNRQSMLVQSFEDSQVEQNYSTAAYILRNRLGTTEEHHCFYVTSTIHGEGRTNAAASLAIQLADMEHHTLLIDLDLRNPMIGSLFFKNVEYDHSLNALYRKDINDIEAISNVSAYLDVLPAMIEHHTIMIDGVIIDIIERLKPNYDYIVIDAPPVGIEAEALSLNQVASTALYLVGFDMATIPHIKSGLEKLDKSGIRVLGLLINEVPKSDQVSSDKKKGGLFSKKPKDSKAGKNDKKKSSKKKKNKKNATSKDKPAKKGLFGRKNKQEEQQAPVPEETVKAVAEEPVPEPVVEETPQPVEDNQPKNRIRVKTIDAETGEAVKNASFEVIAAEDIVTEDEKFRNYADEVVGEITCDGDGNGESPDLYYGKYLVRQRNVPQFYGAMGEDLLVEVKEPQEDDAQVNVIRYTLTKVKVTAVDSAGNGILGAEFILRSDIDSHYSTNMEGSFFIQQLNKGTTYRLVQLSTLDTLRVSEDKTLTVDSLGRVEGQVYYELTIVNPSVEETAQDDIPLEEPEEIFDAEESAEEQPSETIVLVKNKIRVHALEKDSSISLPGAEFVVIALDDVMTEDGYLRYFKDEEICTIACDEYGQGESEELFLGTYALKETKAPEGFGLVDADITVEVNETDAVCDVFYEAIEGYVPQEAKQEDIPEESVVEEAVQAEEAVEEPTPEENPSEATTVLLQNKIRIHALDKNTQSSISGARLDVIALEDFMTEDGYMRYFKDEAICTIACDENGMGESEELYLGTYALKESNTPDGYVLVDKEITVDVSEADTVRDVFYEAIEGDVPEETSHEESREEETALEPVEETLDSQEEEPAVSTPASPEDDPEQEKTILEKLFGFEEDEEPLVPKKTLPEGCEKKSIKMKTLDEASGEPLYGASFELYAGEDIVLEDGTVIYQQDEHVDTIICGVDGNGESNEVPYGSYVLKQMVAPSGYKPIEQDVSLVVGRQIRVKTRMRSLRYVFGSIRVSYEKQ